jgi:hypothetical protein
MQERRAGFARKALHPSLSVFAFSKSPASVDLDLQCPRFLAAGECRVQKAASEK